MFRSVQPSVRLMLRLWCSLVRECGQRSERPARHITHSHSDRVALTHRVQGARNMSSSTIAGKCYNSKLHLFYEH